MAGLIDDIDASVNEILRAADLPISVQIVKIGGIAENENDFGTLIERTKESFAQCERTFIDMHDFNDYKFVEKASGSELVREEKLHLDLMRNVPAQVEKFFEIQHFDFDNSNALLNSPDQTNLDSSDTSSQKNTRTRRDSLDNPAMLSPASLSPEKGEDQRLTADNLAKRDSLMMLDEEARQMTHREILSQHTLSQ